MEQEDTDYLDNIITEKITSLKDINLSKINAKNFDKIKDNEQYLLGKFPVEKYAWTQEGIYTDKTDKTDNEEYILSCSKLFIKFINDKLNSKYIKKTIEDDEKLNYIDNKISEHQQLIKEYLNINTPYRGLLVFHELGSGKTRTAINIAECFRKINRNILIFLPASLKESWYE